MQARNPNNALGVDVSHYQGDIDWATVKASGISFAFMKATEGKTMVDDKFAQNVRNAKAAGIIVGAYHFCRAANSDEAVVEAQHFIDTVKAAGGVDLPLVLDIESHEGGTRVNITPLCHAFIDTITAAGYEAMIYTYPDFVDHYLDASLAGVKLWYANYKKDQPLDRAGWTQWEFLQYAEDGTVPGIDGGAVDMNEFKGSVNDLMPTKTPALNQAVAQNIIDSYLSTTWGECDTQMKQAEIEGRTEDAQAWKAMRDWQHLLADNLRLASGIKVGG